ncbi:MAG: hypothetical protein MZW92_27755 [Comamonadaceae bacterium]|nr:hypothetical protein [Comamonadaceae bacterium]
MGLQLKGALDNKIVTDKSKLLEKLEKSYQTVILYKSSQWALKACYQSYVINREFARFLTEAPVPADFTPEQKEQYTQLISQKAEYLQRQGGSISPDVRSAGPQMGDLRPGPCRIF